MKIITVYTVYETVDEYGRHGSLIGVFKTKLEADKASGGRGWYGGNGSVTERKAIVDNSREEENIYLLDCEHTMAITLGEDLPKKMKDLKKKALAKLSTIERELLGIEDKE